MYLSETQNDQLRTLIMGFEIPYRKYIATIIIQKYRTLNSFNRAYKSYESSSNSTKPTLLTHVLASYSQSPKKRDQLYKKLEHSAKATAIVKKDTEVPVIAELNLITFLFTNDFKNIYSLFPSYTQFCNMAEQYREIRNKLDHPGCLSLEDTHLIPLLSFISDICTYLDDKYFIKKTKKNILNEINILQQKKTLIPVKINNLNQTPYLDSQIVCRDNEIEEIKTFVYGNVDDLRKQHSKCIYGYGGVGKTALVIEAIKQIIRDLVNNKTRNDYNPQYILFFSAKKRKLALASATGKIIEQKMHSHFDTCEELINLILTYLGKTNLKKFHDEGLIIIDNLETLSPEERSKVRDFISNKTPSEMQFILTSRNSEDYDDNKKLSGFEAESGKEFINKYIEENILDLNLSKKDILNLLSISKGNTLVLVLSLRRLSKRLIDLCGLKNDFSISKVWNSITENISKLPSNAYETVSEFMFKDTFEQIKSFFDKDDLFTKILGVFAVNHNEPVDLTTICIMTKYSYNEVEAIVDLLCNYLIIEHNNNTYVLNQFAETYIIQQFIPDSEAYETLSLQLSKLKQEITESLQNLDIQMKSNPSLKKIMQDWCIITDNDRITAAKTYALYTKVKNICQSKCKEDLQNYLPELEKEIDANKKLTIHPYLKYEEARIFTLIDKSHLLVMNHFDKIKHCYIDAIYIIKSVDQYMVIKNTKSYASLLWIFGQYLSKNNKTEEGIRYLEEAQQSFESQNLTEIEYYQCLSVLGSECVKYYDSKSDRLNYLKKAIQINDILQANIENLGKVRKYAIELNKKLSKFNISKADSKNKVQNTPVIWSIRNVQIKK